MVGYKYPQPRGSEPLIFKRKDTVEMALFSENQSWPFPFAKGLFFCDNAYITTSKHSQLHIDCTQPVTVP